ncbi:DNA polymerase [Butyrivibrio proteoclasticus]|uniref:DNA polymerase n=1 Tax=Butyrivibrio proteoclasticus TaxID=43305 RepID=UPI00047D862E|nr:DNA polymerase [Butyrivibrio proteoclasticus]
MKISIDLETYSDVDLQKSGVYRYAQSDNFEILLFSYSVDYAPVICIDVANGEEIPEDILLALVNDSIEKWAYNASFERVCLSEWLKKKKPVIASVFDGGSGYINPDGWKCDMIWAAYLGLPLKLAGSGAILGLDEQKMTEGKDLIKYFCCPCKPTKVNGGRIRNLPEHAPEKWELFKKYNIRDVEVEMNIHKRLSKYPVPGFVWDEYHLDQRINDRGILIDMVLVHQAISMDKQAQAELQGALKEITNLENPNSVSQIKTWLAGNGLVAESLGKKQVAELIKTAPDELKKVLELRQQSAKSSVKKYTAMANMVCSDNRARGCFAFYGSHTGRFAGRGIQLQNLPRNEMDELEIVRDTVKRGDYELLSFLYDSVPEVLSELTRTALIPRPGYKFIVADFAAIEARVLSWLAGEEWRMEVFANNGDIYCETASRMFKKPVVKHGINGELRAKGKQCELSCGYGGSVGALKNMGAIEAGMKEEELQPLVDMWRESNPQIVSLWYEVDRAAKTAIINKTTTETHGIKFICKSGMLFIILPSGRMLSYVKPKMGINRYGSESITYEGTDGTKHWNRLETFGGKLVENIIQALSRDILCNSMKTLSSYSICAHVHDEVIIECPMEESVDYICRQMAIIPTWAEGLLLRADGYESLFYKKD